MHERYRKLTLLMAMQLAAPHTWVASVSPALFGLVFSVLAGWRLSLQQALSLVGACICMQASVNTLNDYADFVKGADTKDDYVEKADSVLVYNAVNPHSALLLGIFYFAVGVLLGVFGCMQAGVVPFYIGLIGGITVVVYSIGPLPVSYLPIGEVISGFVMGALIPLGIAASADGKWHWSIIPYSLPLVIGIALIMMSNNGSDIEKDRCAGRKTLPVFMGRKNTLLVYRALIVLWVILLCVLPIIKLGYDGRLSIFVVVPLLPKLFLNLLRSELLPENRVRQMKSIVLANICGNGLYIAVFAVALLMRTWYG